MLSSEKKQEYLKRLNDCGVFEIIKELSTESYNIDDKFIQQQTDCVGIEIDELMDRLK